MQKTLLFLFLTAHCAILYLLLASFGTGVAVVSAALIPPPITLPDSLADYYSNHHQQQQQNQYEYEHGHASSSSSSFSLDASSSDSSDPDPPSQGELLNAIFSVRRFSSEVFRVIVPPCTDELSVSLRRLGPAAHTISLELRHNAFPTQLAQDTIVVNRTNFTYNVVVPRPKAGTWIALVLYDNSTGRTAMHPLYDSNKVTLRMSMTATTFSGPVHEATHLGAQPQYFVAQPSPTEGEMVFSFSVAPRTSLLAVNVLATSGTQACLRYGALPLANSLAGTRCWAPLNTSDTNTSFALSVHVPEEGLWFLSITGTETEAENEVWLSVSESVCPSGLAGEDCSGVLSETERSLPGSYSAFEYLRDNRSDEGWVYFMYDHTYSQVFGDTLYFGPLSLYANATLYLRRNAPPTKDTYDLTLNDLDNYKVVHPEHTVWYAGVYVPDYKELYPNASFSSFYFVSEKCENSCNGHTCQLSFENGFLTGECHCSMTKGGSDCSQRVKSQSLFVVEVILLVASNVAFVPAIYYAYSHRYYVECLLFCLSMVVSALYHLCDEAVWCVAGSYSVLQFSDFFFAFSSVIAVAFVLSGLVPKVRLPLFYAMEIALYMMFADDTTSAVYFVIVFVLTLVIILVSWAVLYLMSPARSIKGFVVKLFTVLDVRLIVAGLGIVLFSIISFVVETNKTYFIWHSLWHVCVMIGAWLLLFSAKFKVDMGLYGNMSMFADTRSFYIYTDPEAEENNGCDESALMTGSGNNLDELKKTN